ncbi:substrate-binding periplasmic protein [Roseateles violae]|uniref:Transporter substrate-binding domain-containing protein n=1 Tax=Roseateles violae TaxID=3058042 RepID=A0ABT8DWD1_9BURK|nr:transporter substrate-binding domain-containing protein [Pelomonas sp. PFR6]MDN3921199.1 transporter substrate-binding domain-containing protein [Pelomonas sp. PFR6]
MLLLGRPAQAGGPLPLLIEYRDKPPYSYTEHGQPAGLLIDKTQAICKRAGLACRFSEVPLKRILQNLQGDERPLCSPGWYKLPEREAYARFSAAMHQDRPHLVLAAAGAAPAVRAHAQIASLVRDERLLLGVVDGVSYGPELDRTIAQMARPPLRATVTALQLSKMLGAERADYMFIDQEDLDYLNRHGEISARGVRAIKFPDAPPGLFRYFMCSKRVDKAVLARLDEAIRRLGYDGSR